MKKTLLKFPVTSFFIFTLIWSSVVWLVVLPIFNISATSGSSWFWLGECAPGLGAILITFITSQRKGVVQLIKPITYWRINPFYYYLIIVLVGLFYLSAIGLTALQGDVIPTVQSLYSKVYSGWFGIKFYGLAMIPLFTILYFLCEELGWRGYALPKLMRRYDAFTSAIIIGMVWTLFHLPLMKYSAIIEHPSSLILYTVYTIMSSLFLTWIYLKTNGSLLIVSLSHAFTDMYGAYSPTIISHLGQGETGSVIFLRLLFFLPIFILLFRDRHKFQELFNKI